MKESGPQQISSREKKPSEQVLGWTVESGNTSGAKIVVNQGRKLVTVNDSQEIDQKNLRLIGFMAVAREVSLQELLRNVKPAEAMGIFSGDKQFTREILQLTGVRLLKEREPKKTNEVFSYFPPSASLVGEFKIACATYLATGTFPPVSADVLTELKGLPISPKTTKHLLDSLTDERVALSRKKDYFDRFLTPSFERLRNVEKDLRTSQSEDFQPSTDDNQENKELDESEIMQRVTPFVGGYFREKVLDGVDWGGMRMVATGVSSEKLLPQEERVLNVKDKIHIFHGINGIELSEGEISAPLPSSADILPETATKGLSIRRSVNGTYVLEWVGESEPPEEYEFSFERKEIPQDWQKAEPTEAEQEFSSWVLDTLSSDTKEFITNLIEAKITNSSRVRQIARRVQTTIEYVNDTAVGSALSSSGRQYLAKLEEIKKGDCDVSNFYALALIRSLNIPCRMVTGFHVNRDKRFPFSALAGTKHAWLEWWNEENNLWERIDATPPKSQSDEDKDQDNSGSGSQSKEMGLNDEEEPTVTPEETDEDPFGLPFEEDDLQKLKEFLNNLPDGGGGGADIAKIFEDLHGVSKERWEEILAIAESVGAQQLPRDATIEKTSTSTVAEEWKRIYNILLVAYRLPNKSKRTMGKQSQGGELTDPVSAVIDIMTGSEDPYGFEQKVAKEQLEKLPIRFSNDFLLDVTASMEAKNREGKSLLELERQFVLSSLFEGYRLNERVKQRADGLFDVPQITNHVLSIHGDDNWQEIIKNTPAGLKELVDVNEALKKSTPGAGAMAEAIEQYVKTLEADTKTIEALKNKEMAKTLTILTDGNLWCSACGKESCTFELHGPSLTRVNKALARVRELGVIVNAIGFTEQSRPVTQLFAVAGDPEAALVAETLGDALTAHHRQTVRVMKPVVDIAKKRQLIFNK